MEKSYVIYPETKIGENAKIGLFSLVGYPCNGEFSHNITVIGENAVIRPYSIIYEGNTIGNNFQTGAGVSVRESNIIGNNVSIGTHSVIEHHVVIEDGVRIHSDVFIPEYSVLKKNCWIGPCVVVTNALHPKCPKVKDCIKGITVGENTIIGANVTTLPDIFIVSNCLIAAGSLVTKSIEESGVYAGTPCKKIMELKDIKCRYNLISNPYCPEVK